MPQRQNIILPLVLQISAAEHTYTVKHLALMCIFTRAICMEDKDVNSIHSSVVKIKLILMTAKMSPRG